MDIPNINMLNGEYNYIGGTYLTIIFIYYIYITCASTIT
jgi:hypothetical protein